MIGRKAIVLGIDPGTFGAVAAVQFGKLLGVLDMPTLTRMVGKSKRTSVSPQMLADALRAYLILDECEAYIEDVHAMPKQGVTSVFTFGFAFGIAQGVLAGLEIPTRKMKPQQWRPLVGLQRADSKDDARQRAASVWPEQARLFSRVKDHNRADAALIALAGCALQKGT